MSTVKIPWRTRLIERYQKLVIFSARAKRLAIEENQPVRATGRVMQFLCAEIFAFFFSLFLGFILREEDISAVHKKDDFFSETLRFRRSLAVGVVWFFLLVLLINYVWHMIASDRKNSRSNVIEYTWTFANPTASVSYGFDSQRISLSGGVARLVTSSIPYGTDAARGCSAIIEAREPFVLGKNDAVVGFAAVGTAYRGALGFQISSDGGTTWYAWKNGTWETASRYENNYSSLEEVSRAIGLIPRMSPDVRLLFRARLAGTCLDAIELSSVTLKVLSGERFTRTTEQVPSKAIPINAVASVPATFMSLKPSASVPSPYGITIQALPAERTIYVSGQALAYAHIGVFIDNPEILFYRTQADSRGNWEIRHNQTDFRLSNGRHVVYAVMRDVASPFVSEPSDGVEFELNDNPLPRFIAALDPVTTFITLLVLSGALVVAVFKPTIAD